MAYKAYMAYMAYLAYRPIKIEKGPASRRCPFCCCLEKSIRIKFLTLILSLSLGSFSVGLCSFCVF